MSVDSFQQSKGGLSMSEVKTDAFGAHVEFPAFPDQENPDNEMALRRIIAGESALLDFYSRLDAVLDGEARFVSKLLRRDWDARSRHLISCGTELLEQVGLKGKTIDSIPTAAQMEKAAASLRGASAPLLQAAASSFASRALICGRIVPWVSDAREVFEYFKRCLEAEDHHLAVLDLFGDLLEPEGRD